MRYWKAPHCPTDGPRPDGWERGRECPGVGWGSGALRREFTCPPLHPIYPLGEHRPAWQLFSLGSFPGTVWGKWAINPMPGPALAQNQVGECVWVVLDLLMFIIHLQPRALYKMSLNPNKHLLYLPTSLFSLPPFSFLSPKTFTLQITSIPSWWNCPLAATIYIKYWAPLENCFNCDNYTWKDRVSP